MKYTYFGFSQRAAVDMGLDLVDLAILRYFVDFKDSGYMVTETVNSETYYWVKYEALIKANPILGINSKRTLARRLKSMADKGVLKRYVKRSGGVFTFYTIGDQYSRLIDDRFTAKPLDSKVQTTGLKSPMGMDSKVQTKDSSIKKDSSNKDVVNANKFYQDNFSLVTPYIADCIQGMVGELGEEMTIQAMKVALKNNVRKIRYVEAILYDWSKNNIRTIDDLKAHELERQHPGTQTNRAKDVEETQKMLAEMWGDDE